MLSLSLAIGRATLGDRFVGRGIGGDCVLIAAGAALTAIVGQFQLVSWPVALTAQTLAVFLVGSFLGSLRGTLSIVLYLLLGVLGLPVFAAASSGIAVLAGPTGGYILGFVAAAALTGWAAQRGWDRTFATAALSFSAATAAVFALALPWLAVSAGLSLSQAAVIGLYPFLLGAAAKVLLAAAIVPLAWRSLARQDARAAEEDLASESGPL